MNLSMDSLNYWYRLMRRNTVTYYAQFHNPDKIGRAYGIRGSTIRRDIKDVGFSPMQLLNFREEYNDRTMD